MKRCIIQSLVCLAFALLLPMLLWYFFPPETERSESSAPDASVPEEPAPAAVTEPLRGDGDVTISLLHGEEILSLTLEEYLPGVLAGEMPASFAPDALRAQAVAARTYAVYRHRTGTLNHPGVDVCDDPGCCQVWLEEDELKARWGDGFDTYYAAIRAAVEETDGQYLIYNGEPILACFHASSAGQTENVAALWGTALPYLVSVSSPETADDVPNYVSTVERTPDELRAAVEALDPRAVFDGTPDTWIGARILDTSDRVAAIRIGGVSLSGTQVRALFALRSANFTLEWTGSVFRFTVTGSGHGAGMSQYGANVMAQSGSTWQEILAHYYPGTELSYLA